MVGIVAATIGPGATLRTNSTSYRVRVVLPDTASYSAGTVILFRRAINSSSPKPALASQAVMPPN